MDALSPSKSKLVAVIFDTSAAVHLKSRLPGTKRARPMLSARRSRGSAGPLADRFGVFHLN
jgi:hypothetical protein